MTKDIESDIRKLTIGRLRSVMLFAGLWVAFVANIVADRIPEVFNKGAIGFVFLRDTNGSFIPNGTCFFVGVSNTNRTFCHLVTAKHVLQDTNKSFFSQVFVRLNKPGGGTEFAVVPLNNGPFRVFTHQNPGVDLAVIPVPPKIVSRHQIQMIPSDLIATTNHIRNLKIREGDEMFFMGLFTPFIGAQANIPIVRFGRLSMLTDELIPMGSDGPQHFYFMETQVFGGNSGSPVFFYFDQFRNPNDTQLLLAGVVYGYFPNDAPIIFAESRMVPLSRGNTGIALVTPGYLINEILFSDELKKLRGEN